MKYEDIITEDAPSRNIQNMISTIALSLMSSGKTQVNLKSLCNEIRKRTGIDVPYGAMMDILNSLPMVQDVNSDMVTFASNDAEGSGFEDENPEEQVSDMATKAAVSNMKQDN